MNLGEAAAPLALYIHWPFCVSKCPYCDFNSHVREAVDIAAYRIALIDDTDHEYGLTSGRKVGSIFFGGGTPSLMPPDLVAALIEAADQRWGLIEGAEITLEANPSSVEAARFAGLAAAGVNRVSLGVQSLEDAALVWLGRAHGAAEALSALTVAQTHFARVNIDLIYARPDQSEAQWADELARALSLGTDHLSLYQLTIEPGTRFASDVAARRWVPLDADLAAAQYELTQAMTSAAGRPAYEVSNHAAPGNESRHNLAYWRYQDYVGIGPGAHGRRGGLATVRHKKPENWLGAVGRNGHGVQHEDELSIRDRGREALIMGLRLIEGVDLAHVSQRTGQARAALINVATARHLAAQGLLERSGDRIAVTAAGFLLLDGVLAEIVN